MKPLQVCIRAWNAVDWIIFMLHCYALSLMSYAKFGGNLKKTFNVIARRRRRILLSHSITKTFGLLFMDTMYNNSNLLTYPSGDMQLLYCCTYS